DFVTGPVGTKSASLSRQLYFPVWPAVKTSPSSAGCDRRCIPQSCCLDGRLFYPGNLVTGVVGTKSASLFREPYRAHWPALRTGPASVGCHHQFRFRHPKCIHFRETVSYPSFSIEKAEKRPVLSSSSWRSLREPDEMVLDGYFSKLSES